METNSHPEAAASNVKQGQYSPRKRKDTTPRVNPQLAVELVYQELKRVEVYTKRIEDATARKVQIDGKSLESVHFLLNYIRRVADAAHEKLGVFNYRRAQFVNAVQAAQIAHFFFDILPLIAFAGQNVLCSLRCLNLHCVTSLYKIK